MVNVPSMAGGGRIEIILLVATLKIQGSRPDMRATRIKLEVHDGFGVWCTARRLHHSGKGCCTSDLRPPSYV